MRSQSPIIQAPGGPSFELHTLGWRAFQGLCATILSEVWGQSVHSFADTRDAGRDGAFFGTWKNIGDNAALPEGPVVIQCKFHAAKDSTLSLRHISDELEKIDRLVSNDLCRSYVLMTNARVTGDSDAKMRAAIAARGPKDVLILNGTWINQAIATHQRLRMLVPRVYGLGDLSQILDERAYNQARALLTYLKDELATFVVTDAYRRAAEAITHHGFCLLLGEPAVGKSVIAATLAMTAIDNWNSLTIRAETPEDIIAHWNPNESSQFFWIDDAFGTVRHERALTDDWARRLPKVMAAIKGGAKVVLTSRDYIYRDARPLLKEYYYPLLREHKVVIDVAKLSLRERQQIVYNHVRLGDQPKKFRSALKPHLASVSEGQPFRPEVARRLGRWAFTRGLPRVTRQSVLDFMTKPNEFLRDIYGELETRHIGALALVYQAGELPTHFETMSSEQIELLSLLQTRPTEINESLESLNGTFLRRAQRAGSSDPSDYWSFRHPTLREGFASHIARNSGFMKVLIQGLDDTQLLNQLDCGSGAAKGTLVLVPPPLYGLVARRVSAMPATWTWEKGWFERSQWFHFLGNRCSREFLTEYIRIDDSLIRRCLRIGSYLSVSVEIEALAKLHSYGLISEAQRLDALNQVELLAVETPDADWLDIPEIRSLFSESERAGILERVRRELIPHLNRTISDWELNEQGDSAQEYYRPLYDALRRYRKAFSSNRATVSAIDAAIKNVDELEKQARYWQDEDDDVSPSTPDFTRYAGSDDMGSRSITEVERDIFEDVDVDTD